MKAPEQRRDASEKRTAARVPLHDLSSVALVRGRRMIVELEDLSPGGARLALRSGDAPVNASGSLLLDPAAPPERGLPFVIVRRDHDAALMRTTLQVRFPDPDQAQLRLLSNVLVPRYLDQRRVVSEAWRPDFVIEGRREITTFLNLTLLARGRMLSLWKGQRLLAKDLMPFKLDWDRGVEFLECVLPPGVRASHLDLAPPLRLAYSGDLALTYFDVPGALVSGDEVRFLLPECINQQVNRLNPRVQARPGDLSLAFDHPRLHDLRLEKHPLDLSYNGVSIEIDPQRDLLFLGEQIPGLILQTVQGEVPLKGVIRNVRSDAEGGVRYGVELRADGVHDQRAWGKLFFSLQHPHVSARPKEFAGEALGLLERAKYTKKIPAYDPVRDRKAYVDSWKRVGEGRDVGTLLIYPDAGDRQSLGTVSLNRLFTDLWCVHHLAIDRKHPDLAGDRWRLFDVAAAVYGGAATYMYYTDCRYFRADFAAFKGWNDLIFQKFTGNLRVGIERKFDPYHLYSYASAVRGDSPGRRFPVMDADQRHLHRLLTGVLDRLPRIEALSHDYTAETLDLAALTRDYQAVGLLRARDVLVTAKGRDQAFAIVEYADPGLNLFGLFNEVRAFLDLAEPANRPEMLAALVAEARERYLARGIHRFVVADHTLEKGTVEPVLEAEGFRFVEPIWRFITPREIMPYYRNFMNETIAAYIRLDREREKQDGPRQPEGRA